MNHKKKLANSPLNPKCRAKKTRAKPKESPSPVKENRERPPTRRNLNDAGGLEKTRNTPLAKVASRSNRSSVAKFKSVSYSQSPTPRDKSLVSCEQHEYLQFSLRITEEIIRNDLYKNEEMIHVLKNHYQANKARLNQDKLLKTIAELCAELNIPMDDSVLLFLEDRGSYSRGDASPEYSSMESPYMNGGLTAATPNLSLRIDADVNITPAFHYAASNGLDTETPQFLPVDLIESDERTSRQQPEISADENATKYEIQVIQSPTNLEDYSRAFEFGEETLKAPGEESLAGLETSKDFQVLHDGTSKFHHSDKESDISLEQQGTSYSDTDRSKSPVYERNLKCRINAADILKSTKDKLDLSGHDSKKLRTLVVSHYSTCVEPLIVEKKEFSMQTSLEDCHVADTTYVNDASTQKSVSNSISDNSKSNETASIRLNRKPFENELPLFDKVKTTCKRCNCENDEQSLAPSATSQFLNTNSEPQYVLLDCPVLIPREHTKSMDILAKASVNFDTMGKSFHTLNLRMPAPSHFMPKSSLIHFKAPDKPPANLHTNNTEIYDLTPQKDMLNSQGYSHSESLGNANYTGNSCCSCIVNENNNLLLTSNRYERYKKVNENLSYFYPTIATQVSSMDLMTTDLSSVVRERERDVRDVRENYERFTRMDSTQELRRAPPTPDGSGHMFASFMAKKEKINLDNYRIESKHNMPFQTGQKRHYGEDVTADREVSSPVYYEDDMHKVDRIPYKNSTDSMEKRIQSLRHDIEKYSKDDDLTNTNSLRNQTSQINLTESSRRGGDLLDMLKGSNKSTSGVLPSDVSLPRHKKMSVLRKHQAS